MRGLEAHRLRWICAVVSILAFMSDRTARSDGALPTGFSEHITSDAAGEHKHVVFVLTPHDACARQLHGWLAETGDAQRALKILGQAVSNSSIDRSRDVCGRPGKADNSARNDRE